MFAKPSSLLLGGLLLFSSSLATAQIAPDKPSQADVTPIWKKAAGAIGAYVSILATSNACKIELDKIACNAIYTNIGILKIWSNMSSATVDQLLADFSADYSKDKTTCVDSDKYFDITATTMAKAAEKNTEGTGITLNPLPERIYVPAIALRAPFDPKSPKDAAKVMIVTAYMIEAAAGQCKIELTGTEYLNLERAKYYYRGKADLAAAEVEKLGDGATIEVRQSRTQFCAPGWNAKSKLNDLMESIK